MGFIRKLPHSLVAAFRATLEEVVEADLLLHVVDARPDGVEEREAAVDAVLEEIGAGERPSLLVLNKADRADPERLRGAGRGARPGAVPVSALTGEGLADLLERVSSRLELAAAARARCASRRRTAGASRACTRPGACSATRSRTGR